MFWRRGYTLRGEVGGGWAENCTRVKMVLGNCQGTFQGKGSVVIRIRWNHIIGLLDPNPSILNHGSGSGSGSLLFIKDYWRNLRKNDHIFTILTIYNIYWQLIFFIGHKNAWVGSGVAGSAINWPPGSGSVIQDYGFADPDLTEIFTDPQHWVGNIPSGTGSPVSRK